MLKDLHTRGSWIFFVCMLSAFDEQVGLNLTVLVPGGRCSGHSQCCFQCVLCNFSSFPVVFFYLGWWACGGSLEDTLLRCFLGNMVLRLFPNIQHPHKPWFTKGFTSLGPVRGCLWLGDGIKRIDSGTQSLEVARPNLLLCVAALCSSNSTMSFVCSQCQTQGEVPKFSKSWQISWRNSAARALLDMLLTP